MSVPAASVVFKVKVRPATSSAQTVFDRFNVTTGFLFSSTFMETIFVGEPPLEQSTLFKLA